MGNITSLIDILYKPVFSERLKMASVQQLLCDYSYIKRFLKLTPAVYRTTNSLAY